MPQKIASIEKKLRKMSATEACGRNAANIIRETVSDGKIFTDEPTEDGGKKLIRQICRRFLMVGNFFYINELRIEQIIFQF